MGEAERKEAREADREAAKNKDWDAQSDSTAATLCTPSKACEEQDKEVARWQKKLREIAKLEERAASGERLDPLQVEKVEEKFKFDVELERALIKAGARARQAASE